MMPSDKDILPHRELKGGVVVVMAQMKQDGADSVVELFLHLLVMATTLLCLS